MKFQFKSYRESWLSCEADRLLIMDSSTLEFDLTASSFSLGHRAKMGSKSTVFLEGENDKLDRLAPMGFNSFRKSSELLSEHKTLRERTEQQPLKSNPRVSPVRVSSSTDRHDGQVPSWFTLNLRWTK